MTRLELQQKLMEFPPDTHIEVCVRTAPDYAVDYEIADITPVFNANWATISLGEMICDHA